MYGASGLYFAPDACYGTTHKVHRERLHSHSWYNVFRTLGVQVTNGVQCFWYFTVLPTRITVLHTKYIGKD